MRRPELVTLESFRLDQQLSLRALAARMAAARVPVSPTTLHRLLTQPTRATVRSGTLHKVRRFLMEEGVTAWLAVLIQLS